MFGRAIVNSLWAAFNMGVFAAAFWFLRDVADWSEPFALGAAIVGVLVPDLIEDDK